MAGHLNLTVTGRRQDVQKYNNNKNKWTPLGKVTNVSNNVINPRQFDEYLYKYHVIIDYSMEAKLASYRLKKRREAMVEAAKNTFQGALSWKDRPAPLLSYREDKDDVESIDSVESIDVSPPENPVITQVTYLLYFLLWATLYVIALQFEFGAVYFILSALFCIWKNTRSGPKKRGEVSAYSVFNPNCEPIQGSINLEQLEREMGYRAATNLPG